jgi:transcriptional regulator with XRE-family HTH domain
MQSIPQTNTTNTSALGSLLRQWRRRRNVSQMELALEARTSTRHLSFIETGRAIPSPGILEALLAVLNVPLHEANIFRHLARFGPECPLGIGDEVLPEEGWDALTLLLSGQEAAPAIAFDSLWNIIMVNEPYARFVGRYFKNVADNIAPLAPIERGRLNAVHLILAPDGYRKIVANWEVLARSVLGRLRQNMLMNGHPGKQAILHDVMKYPDVERLWNEIDLDAAPPILMEVEMVLGGRRVRTRSAIATLGAPAGDTSFSGISIETFHAVRK